jgi:hypothetical protein
MRFRVNAESRAGGASGQIRFIRFRPQVKDRFGHQTAFDVPNLSDGLGRQETPNSEIWESALANLSLMITAKSEV